MTHACYVLGSQCGERLKFVSPLCLLYISGKMSYLGLWVFWWEGQSLTIEKKSETHFHLSQITSRKSSDCDFVNHWIVETRFKREDFAFAPYHFFWEFSIFFILKVISFCALFFGWLLKLLAHYFKTPVDLFDYSWVIFSIMYDLWFFFTLTFNIFHVKLLVFSRVPLFCSVSYHIFVVDPHMFL
jgi:hypothetical protein